MSDGADLKAIDRGHRARALLTNDLLVEARELVRASIRERWEKSPVRDGEGREYLFLLNKALTDVWAVLEQALNDGKVAEHSLELRRQAEKSRFSFFSQSQR